jgi:monoterpene epsilon-lactone hydrolase
VLYLHGGGYVSGSPATHRMRHGAAGACEAGARLFALDYRLAPEHPFPAALEDAWAAYWWLITEAAYRARSRSSSPAIRRAAG